MVDVATTLVYVTHCGLKLGLWGRRGRFLWCFCVCLLGICFFWNSFLRSYYISIYFFVEDSETSYWHRRNFTERKHFFGYVFIVGCVCVCGFTSTSGRVFVPLPWKSKEVAEKKYASSDTTPLESEEKIPEKYSPPDIRLKEKGYVAVHLFSGSNARGLSPERKRALIEALALLPLTLVVTGSAKETASLGTLPPNALSVETSLQELAHLIDHSAGMVSLDTGAAHIAAHLRKPLVVLSSCVGVQWWNKDMYGESVPTALFERIDVCKGGHDYSGYAQCLDIIDFGEVAARARALFV